MEYSQFDLSVSNKSGAGLGTRNFVGLGLLRRHCIRASESVPVTMHVD